MNNYYIKLKYIILGDAGVGKTSIIKRKTNDYFSSTYLSTIGVDYINLKYYKDKYNLSIAVWDTAGQEKFKNIINVYYRSITAAIIVYDITSLRSFNNIKEWIDEIKDASPNCYIIIVGNKTDLEHKREVFPEHIDEFKEKYNNYFFIESSSKNGNNIHEIFDTLNDKIYNDIVENKISFDDSNGIQVYKDNKRISVFKIEETPIIKKSKGCCTIL